MTKLELLYEEIEQEDNQDKYDKHQINTNRIIIEEGYIIIYFMNWLINN